MAVNPRQQQDDDDVTIGPDMHAGPEEDITMGPDDDATIGPDLTDADEEDITIGPDMDDDGEDIEDATINTNEDDEHQSAATVVDEAAQRAKVPAPEIEDQTVANDDEECDADDLTIGIDGNVRDEDEEDLTVMGDFTDILADVTTADDGSSGIDEDDMTIMSESVAANDATRVPDQADDNDRTVVTELETQNDETASTRTRFGKTRTDKTRTTDTFGGKSLSGKTRFSQSATRMDGGKKGRASDTGNRGVSEEDRYSMVDNFARGGMGNIWLAKDGRLHREVAYKELLPRAMRRSSVVERFIQEGQVTGQLEHPGIVPIYDLGYQENGTPYYAMKLVRGTEMKDQIEGLHKLPRNTPERHRAFVKLLGQFVDVCNALAFAHQRGVLHRDLKPQNVMIGDFGETLVLDWGLAKLLGRPEPGGSAEAVTVSGKYDDEFDPGADEDQIDELGATRIADGSESEVTKIVDPSVDQSAATKIVSSERDENASTKLVDDSPEASTRILESQSKSTDTSTAPQTTGNQRTVRKTVRTDARVEGTTTRYGSVMGTLAYMPPEQAEGKLDEMDARTDIYSLGAILYEILVNDAPIPRGKMQAMLEHVKNKPIKPPHEVDPTVPRPLDAIAMKALSKQKEGRYRSALDLARDVEDYLADEPVSAYPEPWYDKLRRWAKRHRTAVVTTSATVAVLILGSIAWNWIEANRIDGLRSAATAKAEEAHTAASTAEYTNAVALLNEALGLVGDEETLGALRDGLEQQLYGVKHDIATAEAERLHDLRRDVEQKQDEAAAMAQNPAGLNDARTLLTEALALIADESSLEAIRQGVQKDLDEVNRAIGEVEARQFAHDEFERFLALVEQARFYFTVSTGDDVAQNLQTAFENATQAFTIYGGMSAEYLRLPPPYLSEEQVEEIRRDSYELLILLAEREEALALDGSPSEQAEAAKRALDWITLAERLEIPSRALLRHKARYADTSGDADLRDLTLLAAENVQPETALDFYLLGEEYRREADFQNALNHYRRALQIAPDHFWSLYQMGLSHLLDGQPAAAVAAFTVCITKRPDEPICYVTRGTAYGDLNQTDDALADLDKAHELNPDFWAVYLNRGAIHLARNDFRKATDDFSRVIEIRPQLAGPHLNLARTYEKQNRYADTESAASRAIELDSTNVAAYSVRALARLQLSKHDEALADYLRVTELDRNPQTRAVAWKEVGLIHHRAERSSEALEAYEKSLADDDSAADTHRLHAEMLLAANRDEEAIVAFDRYLELGGKPVADVFRARSLAKQKLGKFRESLADVARALELEPQASNMLVRRGWAFLLEANRLALADFDEAVKANPENPDAWNGRGYSKVMMGSYAAAVADAEEGLKRAAVQFRKQGASAWPHLYNPATIYAQAVKHVQNDDKQPAETRERLAKQFTVRSLQIILQTVQAAGAANQAAVVQTVKADSALDPIRQSAEFKQVFGPPPQPATPDEKGDSSD